MPHNTVLRESKGRPIIEAALGPACRGRRGAWDQPGFENGGGK